MDKKAQINALLRKLASDQVPVQVWPAVVKSVEGLNCTVDVLGTDLVDVEDVSLRADDDAEEGVLLVPKVGSMVYVSAVENAMDNLFVVFVSEVDRIEAIIQNMNITVDGDAVTVKRDELTAVFSKDGIQAQLAKSKLALDRSVALLVQDQTTVELKGGKVSIKNSGTSLKTLFDDLATLLQAFTVTCAAPGAPSAPFPATVAQVTQLQTKANLLLQ